MSCFRYEDAIVDLARGVGIESPWDADLRAHLGRCAACATALRTELALTEDLSAIARIAEASEPPSTFEGRLVEAFRALQIEQSQAAVRRDWRSAWRIAAVVALVVGGAVAWRLVTNRPPVEDGRQSAAPRSPVPDQPPAVVMPSGGQSGTVSAAPAQVAFKSDPQPVRRGRKRSTPRIVEPVGFVSLPWAAGLPAFESGEIVRVQLALETLPTYGVPMPDAARNPVDVELLVAQDGRPRAIRLLRPATETRSVQ